MNYNTQFKNRRVQIKNIMNFNEDSKTYIDLQLSRISRLLHLMGKNYLPSDPIVAADIKKSDIKYSRSTDENFH